jgi:hypothetical protein
VQDCRAKPETHLQREFHVVAVLARALILTGPDDIRTRFTSCANSKTQEDCIALTLRSNS